jgi:hypothetical protein
VTPARPFLTALETGLGGYGRARRDSQHLTSRFA